MSTLSTSPLAAISHLCICGVCASCPCRAINSRLIQIFHCSHNRALHTSLIRKMTSAWYMTFISLLQASRFQHMAWKLPRWALIVDLDVRRKRTMHHLANFYSLITFIGPRSHLRNHGDADKVTHDYSSMVEPDCANPRLLPKEPCRSVFINSLRPCSTFLHLWMAKKRLCLSQFVFSFRSCPPPPFYSPIDCALRILQPFLSHSSPLLL